MAGFLDEIEPLKQTALAELKAAPDLAALEQTKGAWIGPNGKFTALMKQLGTLSKEEKPAAGKLINAAKVELEAALVVAPRGTGTESRAAERADRFHAARTPPRARQIASAHAGHRRHRPRVPQDWFRRRRRAGDRGRVSLLRRAQHARRPSRARFAGHVLSGQRLQAPDAQALSTASCARTLSPSKSA